MSIFYTTNIDTNRCILIDEEHNHCKNVLRHLTGDSVHVINGLGIEIEGKITQFTKNETIIEIKNQKQIPPKQHLSIAIAPTKSSERIEWMVEKVTEMGISTIVFLKTQRSERKQININRILKVAIAAIKQSKRAWLPQIHNIITLDEFYNTFTPEYAYIAHLLHTTETPNFSKLITNNVNKPLIHHWLLVGPEGDFTPNEVEFSLSNGAVSVSLGSHVLRTETAAVFGVAAFEHTKQCTIH